MLCIFMGAGISPSHPPAPPLHHLYSASASVEIPNSPYNVVHCHNSNLCNSVHHPICPNTICNIVIVSISSIIVKTYYNSLILLPHPCISCVMSRLSQLLAQYAEQLTHCFGFCRKQVIICTEFFM